VKYDALNAGIYAGYNSGAFFLNGLAKYDHYRIAISDASAGLSSRSNGNSYGVKGEAGIRIGGSGFYAEPNVSVAYVRTNLDTIASQGVTIDFDRMNGLRGTAGLRIGSKMAIGENNVAIFYAAGDYVHEFRGKNGFVLASGPNSLGFSNIPLDDYGRGKIGVSLTSGAVTGFIEGNGIYSKQYKGGGARAGLRLAF
jgi:outer membrane autotransporter protein